MQGSALRLAAIVAVVAITGVLVARIFLGGPDPEIGKCVDAAGAIVGCGERAALYRLVREVDDGRECPSDSLKLYQFRSSLYCGRALRGAPAPSSDYVPCLLLAGAELARGPEDLAFAKGFTAGPDAIGGVGAGAVKVRGENWRIFYVLNKGQLDPGLAAVVADPGKVVFVAYIRQASARRMQVAAATRCGRVATPDA